MNRDKGKEQLKNFISLEKNLGIVEKKIYSLSKDEKEYFDLIYEFCYHLKNSSLKEANEIFKNGKFYWNHPKFDNERMKQEEKDDYISDPIKVEEGAVVCGKCRSSKTYSYQIQARSADEGFTLISLCINCNHKWRTN